MFLPRLVPPNQQDVLRRMLRPAPHTTNHQHPQKRCALWIIALVSHAVSTSYFSSASRSTPRSVSGVQPGTIGEAVSNVELNSRLSTEKKEKEGEKNGAEKKENL